MLPSVDDLKLHLTQNLELSLEKMLGAGPAQLQADRLHRFLRTIADRAATAGKAPPSAVIFAKTAVTLIPNGYTGDLMSATLVDGDDAATDVQIPCNLSSLDSFAQGTSTDHASYYLIYTRSSIGQSFYVGGRRIAVASYSEPCIFLHGTHYDLSAALMEYGQVVASNSDCAYLANCWQPKRKHLLRTKPEKHMRDSLWNFLRRRLSNHIVDREFVVKARKPVDVAVDWKNAKKKAFVEIKWLGKCATTTTAYRPLRAIEGARQLRDHYVDPYLKDHPGIDLIGYLAVYDARKDRSEKIAYPADVAGHPRIRLGNDWEINPP